MKIVRSKFAPSLEMQERAPYLGKAGEHLVLAELLLLQFDAALVEVDTGTDILAEKNNKLFRFQVKTRTVGSDNRSSFALSEKTLARKILPDYYMIVLIDSQRIIQTLVFPKEVILSMVKNDLLSHRKKQGLYYGPLIRKNGSWFIKNLKHDISHHLGAYTLIDA